MNAIASTAGVDPDACRFRRAEQSNCRRILQRGIGRPAPSAATWCAKLGMTILAIPLTCHALAWA